MKNRNIHENWAILDLILHTWKDYTPGKTRSRYQSSVKKDKMKEDVITKLSEILDAV